MTDAEERIAAASESEAPCGADTALRSPAPENRAVDSGAAPSAARGKPQTGDVVKFIALIATILLLSGTVVALWPAIKEAFGAGDIDGIVSHVRDAGAAGVFVLLFLQFLQVLVAFIPGEAVQFAAGALYGPLWGTVLVLGGCAASSALVYQLVHKLGAPFVQTMVSDKFVRRFQEFEHSGKLTALVFILYFIPGLPKDTFSYLVPLTEMRLKVFLGITTVARIPGVFASCLFANGLLQGNYVTVAVIGAIMALVVILCVVKRKPLMEWLRKISN